MRFFAKVRDDAELYISVRHYDPPEWSLCYPSSEDEALLASMTEAEIEAVDRQVDEAIESERLWGD